MSLFLAQEIFTPKYHKLTEIMAAHERGHWVVDEIDLRQDCEQWKTGKITDENKAFVLMILRLFTQADSDICSAYVDKLLHLFKAPDARMMLLSFAARETTHVRGYRLLNETLGYDSEEFMSEFLKYNEMKGKHEFMIENVPLETVADKIAYLARQILMEGVNLFASFAMLLSFSQEGKLPGVVSTNQWSQVDESHHVEGLTELFKIAVEENPSVVNSTFKKAIYEVARTIVQMEDDFIDLCHTVGKNNVATAQQYKDYIRLVCDYRMTQMGLKPQFGIKDHPLPWINLIASNTFVNFFEATSTQYSKASLSGEWVY
jgi:ribonucleoside-diphosphate reductase beta chain